MSKSGKEHEGAGGASTSEPRNAISGNPFRYFRPLDLTRLVIGGRLILLTYQAPKLPADLTAFAHELVMRCLRCLLALCEDYSEATLVEVVNAELDAQELLPVDVAWTQFIVDGLGVQRFAKGYGSSAHRAVAIGCRSIASQIEAKHRANKFLYETFDAERAQISRAVAAVEVEFHKRNRSPGGNQEARPAPTSNCGASPVAIDGTCREILQALISDGGTAQIARLSEMTGKNRETVRGRIGQLVDAGHVQRDGRKPLSITDAGRQKLAACEPSK